jgi:hypothetical protein
MRLQLTHHLAHRSPARASRAASAARAAALGAVAFLAALPACLFGGSDGDDDGPLGGSLDISGSAVDFRSGDPVTEGLALETSGLAAATTISIDGASFKLSGVPESSAFQLLASATGYRATFSSTLVVESDDLDEVKLPLVSEAFVTSLAAGFTINPNATRGILLARVVDAEGRPKANVAASNFALTSAGGAITPKFLSDQMTAAPALAVTSASGWVAFFDVAPGVVSLAQAATATVTLDMAVSPVNAGAVTLAQITATDGAPPRFTNVSFATQVVPIFTMRGCVACHSGGGPGKDLGGLTLNGPTAKIYKELIEEDPTRVRPGMPEQSLLLTMPSRESPPDRHPNVTFSSSADLDFQRIYVWIKEGAKEN